MNIFNKALFIISILFFQNCAFSQKSDHIISDSFGDWNVRHYFNRESLSWQFSDAKTLIYFDGGKTKLEFQFNKNEMGASYIIPGWWDKVTIRVDGKEFKEIQSLPVHNFYGNVNFNDEILKMISNAKNKIEIELLQGDAKYTGYISSKGSSAALRWIRLIS